ncbi:MAG: helix-turn-helix transcriptional regulator [Pseudoxanthomonas sp.]
MLASLLRGIPTRQGGLRVGACPLIPTCHKLGDLGPLPHGPDCGKFAWMSSERKKRAAAQIRSLASLETGGPGVLPLLLRQLGHLLAFDNAAYYWLDEHGQPQMHAEDPAVMALVPLYLDQRMQAAEREVVRPVEAVLREDFGPRLSEELMTVPHRQFLRSTYHNELLRPVGIDDCVNLVLRHPDGRPMGALKLYRNAHWPGFRREELGDLARLEPFLANALRLRAAPAGNDDALHERALLLANPAGRLLWLSAGADALMARAFGTAWRRASGELPSPLREVARRLDAARRGLDVAAPPRLQWRHGLGTFVAEARWMEAASHGDDGDNIAIELEHHLPRRLRMTQHLSRLELPARQFEIACWLTGTHSEPQIAGKLGISLNTLVYHRRRLYERLDVYSREQLAALLSTPA